jgi:hypothetical protein
MPAVRVIRLVEDVKSAGGIVTGMDRQRPCLARAACQRQLGQRVSGGVDAARRHRADERLQQRAIWSYADVQRRGTLNDVPEHGHNDAVLLANQLHPACGAPRGCALLTAARGRWSERRARHRRRTPPPRASTDWAGDRPHRSRRRASPGSNQCWMDREVSRGPSVPA